MPNAADRRRCPATRRIRGSASVILVELDSRGARIAALQGVSAGYGARQVLHETSLALHRGEVFALLGPNGAGKSTLIRLLTRTLAPRTGRVEAHSSAIGLVPQDIALYPWLTPRENCLAFAGLDAVPRREAHRRVENALALTRCEAIARTPVAKLSGGYQRRANIAVALMRDPSLMILDEPTAGLDAEAKRVIRDIILGVRTSGAAVLLVSHELDLIEAVADSIGVLVAGRFRASGRVADVMAELFSQSRVVEILLEGDPRVEELAILQSLRAIASQSSRAWLLQRRRDQGDADRLMTELSDAGLRVREVRFRDPTVADAYSVLTQETAR